MKVRYEIFLYMNEGYNLAYNLNLFKTENYLQIFLYRKNEKNCQ